MVVLPVIVKFPPTLVLPILVTVAPVTPDEVVNENAEILDGEVIVPLFNSNPVPVLSYSRNIPASLRIVIVLGPPSPIRVLPFLKMTPSPPESFAKR